MGVGLDLNYLTVIAAVASLALGFIVFINDRKKTLNISFLIFTVFIAIWASTVFYFQEFDQSLFLLKSQYATGGLVLVTAFPWVILITKNKFNTFAGILTVIFGLIMFFLPYFDGLLIKNIIVQSNHTFTFAQGPLFNSYDAVVLLLVVLIISILYISQRKVVGEEKARLRLILTGVTIYTAVSVVINIILPALGINSVVAYDAQSSLIWVGLTAYTIMRHGLFDIKVIATQSLILLLLALILSRILTANTRADIAFESLVFIFTAVIGYFLSNSVKGEVSRREEVEKLAEEKTGALDQLEQRNKNLATLQKVSEIVMNETDMKEMTQHILDEFPKQMDGCIGALLNVIQAGKLVPYTFTENDLTKKIRGVVGTDLEKYSQPLQKGFNLLHDSLLDKKQIQSDSLADFISPPVPKPIAMTVQRLIGAKNFEAMPLYAGGEPFGVMLFVFSSTEGTVHTKNLEIAKSISDEMSLAVQRAQAFQKLKEANEYLKQLDKMKDEFISMASHELNTPLAAIEGYLSMILDEGMGKVDDKSKEYLTRAYDSSKRLAALILDLLNVSRIEQGRLKMKFAQSNMIDLAESVIKELQIKSDAKKIYLKVVGDKKKIPLTWCDPDRIRQVLVNLTGNAIKFTEKGGVTISVTGDKDFVHVAVSDTGRGIAAEDQKLLFGKFSQVKRDVDEHQGTGLGLYISKNYIELHQGKIWVESEAGKGATFKFDLPVFDKPPLEVKGAVVEKPIDAPQIELRNDKEIPQIITDSSKAVPSMAPAAVPAPAAVADKKPA